jgi:Holliday junction resolvase RusA-like endonuclease
VRGAYVELKVYGLPQPQGSKRLGKLGARFVVLDDNDAALKPWRKAVTTHARGAVVEPLDGPLALVADFTLPRPKSVAKRRRWPLVRPDLSKLVRAVEDALTDAQVWTDDSRVVLLTASKSYVGDPFLAMTAPGVRIEVHGL